MSDDEDEKLHNSEEKLHNSDAVDDQDNEACSEEVLLHELIPEGCDEDEKNDPYMFKAEARFREALKRQREKEAEEQAKAAQAERNLNFSKDELDQYVSYRTKGIAQKSRDWIFRSAEALCASTQGEISYVTLNRLRDTALEKYESAESHSKVLSFAKSFLEFLATTQGEPRYQTFAPYLKPPKAVKERKSVTTRIVTEQDIYNVLKHIERAEREGEISPERSAQYSAFVLFGAYTGQRSEATLAKLTVGQFREALAVDKPVLLVDASQDKVRMSHYVPVHPRVVEALRPLLVGRDDDELMFIHGSFLMWIKRQKIPMSRFKGHFVLGDLREFAEQHGDVIQWDESNRAYILTHGVSGVAWSHYKHPLPENVYDVYMQYWRDIKLSDS